jgi:conjugative transposon TraN protein
MKKERILLLPAMLLAAGLPVAAQDGGRQAPCTVEVGFIKTVHITFPSKVRYVDLGSNYLIAGKAGETENVIRVKAAMKGFADETNFSVICEDGSFYTFTATYRDDPSPLFHEMGEVRPSNSREVTLKDIEGESPMLLQLIMKSIYEDNIRDVTGRGDRNHLLEATLRGIYVRGDILYLHLGVSNASDVTCDIDYVRFTVKDRKRFRQQSSQEEEISPAREFPGSLPARATGRSSFRRVYAFSRFTLPPGKILTIELAERNGGRTLTFDLTAADILTARLVKSIRL